MYENKYLEFKNKFEQIENENKKEKTKKIRVSMLKDELKKYKKIIN